MFDLSSSFSSCFIVILFRHQSCYCQLYHKCFFVGVGGTIWCFCIPFSFSLYYCLLWPHTVEPHWSRYTISFSVLVKFSAGTIAQRELLFWVRGETKDWLGVGWVELACLSPRNEVEWEEQRDVRGGQSPKLVRRGYSFSLLFVGFPHWFITPLLLTRQRCQNINYLHRYSFFSFSFRW